MGFEDEQERTQGEEAESLDYVLVTRTVSTFSGPLGFHPVYHLYGWSPTTTLNWERRAGWGVPGNFCCLLFVCLSAWLTVASAGCLWGLPPCCARRAA